MSRPYLGDPPPKFRDPYVRRLDLPWKDWKRTIRGWIAEPQHIAAALTLAGYANNDGSNARPGIERLAADLCRGPRAVRWTLAALEEDGFITRTSRGGRQGMPKKQANVYQLTIPATLAAALGMWDDQTNGPQWMERPEGAPRRRSTTGTLSTPGRGATTGTTTGTTGATTGTSGRTTGTPSTPHRVLTPLLSTVPIHSESGSAQAPTAHDERDEREDEEQERANEEELEDAYEWIEAELDGLDGTEPSTVDGMLSAGVHPKAIVNTVNKARSSPVR
ncbi:MAG: hypothetical protein WKF51_11540 [Geodermatophilaceae bacterium]